MPKRRILRGEINFISLCKRGANRLPVIYKEDGAFDCEMLMKAADDFMEKGELLAVVYAPEFRDSQGDIASATVIKDMMYSAAKNGESIDIRHDGKALEKNQVFVAERFLVQKGDARFADFKDYDGKSVDVTGAWATVLKIEDQKLRDHYKAGDWNGVSMGGRADLATEKTDDGIVQKVVDAFAKTMGLSNQEDDDMTAAELEAALAKNNEALVKGIGEAVAKAVTPAGNPTSKSGDNKDDNDDKEAKAPVFKGDRTKAEDVAKHQEALTSWNLQKDVDWNDPESVQKYQDELKKFADAKKEAGEEGDSEEVKKLKLEKKEAEDRLNAAMGKSQQGASGAPSASKPDDKAAMVTGLEMSKEDMDLFAVGATMGKAVNDRTGLK